MVYTEAWMENHKDNLAKWEWEFRPYKKGEVILPCPKAHPFFTPYTTMADCPPESPFIILVRHKQPPLPSLRDIYGRYSVQIPCDYEWTGELRKPEASDSAFFSIFSTVEVLTSLSKQSRRRLILRPRIPPTKVWFEVEEKMRNAKLGEWVWDSIYKKWEVVRPEWLNNNGTTIYPYLCATRHEKVDKTPTTVTQADVDKAWAARYPQ